MSLLTLGACTASEPSQESGGNSCFCPAGFRCSQDGSQCLSCAASCNGKKCGDDGCGGSCGSCGPYAQCSSAGVCQPTCELPPIQTATTVDLNLQIFQVTATLTRNGAPLADDPQERGNLVFRDRQTGRSLLVPLGRMGPVNVSTLLMAGTYTVLLDSTGPQSVLPRQQLVVAEDFAVFADRTLSSDLKVIDVRGAVTANGQPLLDDVASRGRVRFRRTDSGSFFDVDLGPSGPVSYSAQLYGGTYDILMDSTSPLQTTLPLQQVQLFSRLSLPADQSLDLELKTAVFTGEITRNGLTLPDSPTDRGSMVFSRSDTGSRLVLPLPLTGPGRFLATVYTGTYDLWFDSTKSQSGLPRQTVPLAGRLLLTRSQVTKYDLRVVTISGLVTLNGGQLPDDPNPRGEVVLFRTDNHSQARVPFASQGPAIYAVLIYAGNYNVLVDSGGVQSVLPQMAVLVKQNLALTTDQRVDVPLTTARLTGRVTLNGGDLPPDPNSRGDLILFDRRSVSRLRTPIPGDGAANYSLTVYPGVFALQFDSSGTAQTVLPQLVTALGNLEVRADAQVEIPLSTFEVEGVVRRNGITMPDESTGQSRGSVTFVHKQTGSRVALDVLGTGEARYATKLYAGSYNVLYDATPPQDVLPQQQTQLRGGCTAP